MKNNKKSIEQLLLILIILAHQVITVELDKQHEPQTVAVSLHTNGPISDLSFMENESFARFKELSNYVPSKRRRTQDGRLCAKAFVQDQTTFFDCTKTRTPYGEMDNREWCYVEPYYTDSRKWNYCIPILDYDRVRGANFLQMKELTQKTKDITEEIKKSITPAQRSMDELKKIKTQQEKVATKIMTLVKTLTSITSNINKLYTAKDECDLQDKKVEDLLFKINGKEREAKHLKEEEEKNSQVAMKTKNCKGLLLYEEGDAGDGLLGYFYDNENWLGNFKEAKSRSIDYDWTDGEPYPGINQNNFSVRWEGWLRIPVTENYIFTIECDDGAELAINGDVVITHKTGSLVESYNNLMTNKRDEGNNPVNKKLNPFESSSNPQHLIGGILVKIVLKYFHSIHTSVYSKGQVFIKLLWQCEEFNKQIILMDYLYAGYAYSPLKITGYNPREAKLRKLAEDDFAFINSDRYILQDIPTEFLELTVLKLKTRYTQDKLEIYTNSPTNAYIAFLGHYPFPLEDTFEDTGLSLTLLQLDQRQEKGSKRLVAQKSSQMKIYKKLFRKGLIQIKFNKQGLNIKGIPLVVFFGFDMAESNPLVCTGKEIVLSDSTSNSFKSCSASSELPGYSCEDGFRNRMRDEEGGMWAAKSDGVGSWIDIHFNGRFELTKFQYRNRKNPSERNRQLEIVYSTGQKQIVNLKNNDDIIYAQIDSVRASSVKITIREVYGTLNNGGAFTLWGLKCEPLNKEEEEGGTSNLNIPAENNDEPVDPSLVPPLFEIDRSTPIFLNCLDSLANTNKFKNLNVKVNKKYVVKCPESCALAEVPIYGTLLYTRDSAICKSAYHSKKISSSGGKVTMIIRDPLPNYSGSMSNGIKSEGKARSFISIYFETYEEEDIIVVKPGSKVDIKVKDENGQGGDKWSPAIITSVNDLPNGKFVKLILDGINSQPFEYPYMREKIHPCGEHIKNRDCKGSLKRLREQLPILIRFVPHGYESDKDFMPDFGQVFGKKGKSYGWSSNMSDKTRRRENPSKPFLETLIEFPPSPHSKDCTKPNPEKLCEPVSWKVKAGKGRFKIRLYVGDPLRDIQVDFRINNKVVAKSAKVVKNKMEIFEDILESKNEMFEITSNCEENCANANTKLNAVELIPYETANAELNSQKPEVETCGSSFIGGRCEIGPDVLNCLFDDPSLPSASFCTDDKVLVNIPFSHKCKEHVGKYKCVNKVYSDENDCKKFCPKPCNDNAKCVY